LEALEVLDWINVSEKKMYQLAAAESVEAH